MVTGIKAGNFRLISFRAEAGSTTNKRVIGYKDDVAVADATQDFIVGVGVATDVTLNEHFGDIDEFRIVEQDGSTDFAIIIDDIIVDDPVIPVASSHTAEASANTLTPVVGVDDEITLTVKNSLGDTDTDFDGSKNVTITGVEAAPDGSYGSFNGTVLDANAAGAGQVISVTFTDGVATSDLKLNKADGQTIHLSIATVTTPEANALTITPTHGTAATMAVTQDITAPALNGGSFAQQPAITLKDAYGNTCTSDNATVVTAAKEDGGTWTLTGTTTATASGGVAALTNLGATNTAAVNNAQLGFTATGLTKVTSTTVTLPAPMVTGGGSGGSSGSSGSTTTSRSSQGTAIVIVNGKEQDAGKEVKTTEDGKSTMTVKVNNKVIESKIDEVIKNNTSGTGNIVQVSVADTTSEVVKVELAGDIVKKLEENLLDGKRLTTGCLENQIEFGKLLLIGHLLHTACTSSDHGIRSSKSSG